MLVGSPKRADSLVPNKKTLSENLAIMIDILPALKREALRLSLR